MLHPIRYTVKDRWLDGQERTIPNPNPTVALLAGHWNRDTGETELFRVTASQFREMTGRIVYGGDVDARGIQMFHVQDDVHRLMMERAGQKRRQSNRKTRDDVMKTPQEIRRLRAIRAGKPLVRTDVKPIRRRKKA